MIERARRFLILGAGGHGRVVADLVRAGGGEAAGFVDADPAKLGVEIFGIPVVSDEASLLARLSRGQSLPGGAEALALGIGDNAVRESLLVGLPTGLVPSLLHPSAVVSPSATIGPGSVVFANAVVNAGARIGSGVIVNTAAVIEHDCLLEDGAHVSPGAVLAGEAQVGRRAWIGAGSTVIQGVRVGADAIVGAGAAVIRDVPSACTVVGVPARVLPRRGQVP